jgi:hypothetical protein
MFQQWHSGSVRHATVVLVMRVAYLLESNQQTDRRTWTVFLTSIGAQNTPENYIGYSKKLIFHYAYPVFYTYIFGNDF